MPDQNDFPLPEGTKLVKGELYGLRVPEFPGDPCAILPYSMVAHDMAPDCKLIQATGEETYQLATRDNLKVEDMGAVHGLLPSMFEKDGEVDRNRPRRGGPMTAAQPTGLMATSQGLGVAAEAEAVGVPSGGTGLMEPAMPSPPAKSKGRAA